jgi:hypothetical protein
MDMHVFSGSRTEAVDATLRAHFPAMLLILIQPFQRHLKRITHDRLPRNALYSIRYALLCSFALSGRIPTLKCGRKHMSQGEIQTRAFEARINMQRYK